MGLREPQTRRFQGRRLPNHDENGAKCNAAGRPSLSTSPITVVIFTSGLQHANNQHAYRLHVAPTVRKPSHNTNITRFAVGTPDLSYNHLLRVCMNTTSRSRLVLKGVREQARVASHKAPKSAKTSPPHHHTLLGPLRSPIGGPFAPGRLLVLPQFADVDGGNLSLRSSSAGKPDLNAFLRANITQPPLTSAEGFRVAQFVMLGHSWNASSLPGYLRQSQPSRTKE